MSVPNADLPSVHQKTSLAVLGHRAALAAGLVDREFARHPELAERYGQSGREKSLQDAGHHLSFLAQALALNHCAVFIDYVAWTKVVLSRRRVSAEDLAFHLDCLAGVLRELLPSEDGALASSYVDAAVSAMPSMPEDLPSFLEEGSPLSPLAHQYFEALRRGERHLASRMVMEAVARGTPVKDIYLHVFQPAQYEVGRLWQTNRITVAEEHYFTAATQLIMSLLYPQIFSTVKNGHTLIATCVAGDLHEIGVRMVADFFEMEGWDTYYLGGNTPHASVVATIVEQKADVLAISTTIYSHVESTRELIRTVRQHPLAGRVKILVGGYPFNQQTDLWQIIGADGTSDNAQQAIALANEWVGA